MASPKPFMLSLDVTDSEGVLRSAALYVQPGGTAPSPYTEPVNECPDGQDYCLQ